MSLLLPKFWASVNLGDVAWNLRGRVKPADMPHLPFVGMAHIEAHTTRLLETVPAHTMKSSAAHFLEDDILYGRLRPYLNKVHLATFEGLCSAEFIPLVAAPGVIPAFLKYRINAADFVSFASRLDEGDRPRVDYAQISEFEFGLPPKDEQLRIVAAIESHLTRIDAAVTALERAQRNLERYRASVLKVAIEGRLVPTEAELARAEGRDYEPASVLLERILKERRQRWEEAELAKMEAKGKPPKNDRWKAKYKEPVEPDTEGLPSLPEGWCWATGDQVFAVVTSGSRDWSKYYDRGTAVFLMAQNVRPGKLDLSYQQLVDPPLDDPSRARSQVRPDDVLVTIVGANTGQVCRVTAELPEHYVCQSVALMRPVLASLGDYIDLYLNSPPGQAVYEAYMYGQGRPHLSFVQLKETPIPLPPAREQTRIVQARDQVASVDESIASSIDSSSSRCSRLRQSVLKWAFEGKLVDQDPADEPASVLLERIRAERDGGSSAERGRRRKKDTARQERLL